MNITSDEARILEAALNEQKYSIAEDCSSSKEEQKLYIEKLNLLQHKLNQMGRDYRRYGRTSKNSFNDCVRRYCTPKKPKKTTFNLQTS